MDAHNQKCVKPGHLIAIAILIMCTLVFPQSLPAPAMPAPPPSTLCIPGERSALLAFKAGLTDPGNYLSSWQGQDCCRWSGVQCSNQTGHVVELQVNSRSNGLGVGTIGGEVSSSLLALRHLESLDLSMNNFGGTPIPEFIGSIRSLMYLDLSYSNFGGRIPPHLGNLSNLVTFTLSNFESYGLYSPDLALFSRLGNLQYLKLQGVNLSTAIDWAHAVNMIPSLLNLDLVSCGLQNTIPPPTHVNLTSLESLYLDSNLFDSPLGAKNLIFSDLRSLQSVSMMDCGIRGPIPDAVGNFTSLQYLNLYGNSFTGALPSTIKNLKKLRTLQLSHNFLSMDITELLHTLPVSEEFQELYLDYNNLTGSLPDRLKDFSSLTTLSLNNNNLSGDLPVGIRELISLNSLQLNSNNLHGVITEDHFANMSNLKHLWISDNSLTVLVMDTWNTPFSLISAGFRSCVLGPQFPAWLLAQSFNTLDISNTSINDTIPSQFWIAFSGAQVLDLSRNLLVGSLPTYFLFGCLEQVVSLDMSSNKLSGSIPTLPKNLEFLDLSGNNLSGTLPSDIGAPMLRTLILFKNSISGVLSCSLLQLQQLKFVDLSFNQLNGTLPDCLPSSLTPTITLLNLNSNNLSGTFPSFLQRCKELKFLDLAYNKFSGTLPSWIGGELQNLSFLRLRSNMFSGGIPTQLTRMKGLQYLDLAYNNFTGNIPWSIGNLRAMTLTPDNNSALFQIVNFGVGFVFAYTPVQTDSSVVVTKGQQLEFTKGIGYMVNMDLSCNSLTGQIPEEIGQLIALKNLNLSWNHLSSSIPSSIGTLQVLESFDLSHNELSGEIPTSLSALTSLARLNLSYNDLTGTIPSGNQLRTLDNQESIYIGNSGLCGPPLLKNCSGTSVAPGNHGGKQGTSDSVSLYISIGIGWVVGLWTVFIIFLFNGRWRIFCFLFSDRMYDWIYVQLAVSYAKIERKMGLRRE